MKKLCSIYKSLRDDGMYLFVDRDEGLERVPELLLARFGEPELVTTLVLTPERKLARTDAGTVLNSISERGFYLQMPPTAEEYMLALRNRNTKL